MIYFFFPLEFASPSPWAEADWWGKKLQGAGEQSPSSCVQLDATFCREKDFLKPGRFNVRVFCVRCRCLGGRAGAADSEQRGLLRPAS